MLKDESGVALGLAVIMVVPSGIRTGNHPKVRFSATVGEEPEVELALV